MIRAIARLQHAREKFSRMRLRIARHLLGSSRCDHAAAAVAAFRPQIDHPVGGFDHVQIVLDDQHRSAAVEQFAKRGQQLLNIVEVQPVVGSSKIYRMPGIVLPGEMRGEFQALRLAAGKRGAGLPEPQIAEADFFEHAQPRGDFRMRGEKCERLAHGQLQHFVNVFLSVAHFEHAALVARAAAFLADQFDVGQEPHFHRHGAIALARFAAAAGNVERKMAGREAALFRFRRGGENFADGDRTPSSKWRDSSAACARSAIGPPFPRPLSCVSPSMRSQNSRQLPPVRLACSAL